MLAMPVPSGQADAPKEELPKARLLAPFDVTALRKRWGKVTSPLTGCPAPPQGPRDLVREDFYTNKSHSVADPAKKKKALDKLAPLWEFTRVVNEMADDYVMSRPADVNRAGCVLKWLDAWAKADERFHRMLVTLCGNARLAAMVEMLWEQSHRARMTTVQLRASLEQSNREHRALLEAIRRRNWNQARTRHAKHRARATAEILKLLQQTRLGSF